MLNPAKCVRISIAARAIIMQATFFKTSWTSRLETQSQET